ncbi:MAG: hypothetical protein R6X02_15130 [Enhygromyxa sp.]
MGSNPKFLASSLISIAMLAPGCTRSAEPGGAEAKPDPLADSGEQQSVAATTSEAGPPPGEPESAAESAEPNEPAPEPAEGFEAAVAELIADLSPSVEAETEAIAWAHYKAKEYVEAQRFFALASLHDRSDWKHPFNLACAAALAKDEAMVRIGLLEAVARDSSEAAITKARKDKDLAAYRKAPWFEPVLHGINPHRPPPPKQVAALPPGVARPLDKARLNRLRSQLQAHHGVRPQLRSSLAHTPEGDGTIAFVVYDYTLEQECKAEKDREMREICLEDLHPESIEHSEAENQTTCVNQYLVRASFSGDEPTLGEPIELTVACAPNEVRRLDLVDIDGDGEEEVVLDTIALTPTRSALDSSETIYNLARHLAILRLDGDVQYQLGVKGDFGLISKITRVFVRDVDADGHLDLIEQQVDMGGASLSECEPMRIDLDLWPACDPADLSEATTTTLRYDPGSDAWVKQPE